MCVNILQSLCQCADVQGLLAAVGKKDYLKYLVYLFEMSNREMEKLSQLHGKPITAQTCVVIQCSFSVKIRTDHLNGIRWTWNTCSFVK